MNFSHRLTLRWAGTQRVWQDDPRDGGGGWMIVHQSLFLLAKSCWIDLTPRLFASSIPFCLRPHLGISVAYLYIYINIYKFKIIQVFVGWIHFFCRRTWALGPMRLLKFISKICQVGPIPISGTDLTSPFFFAPGGLHEDLGILPDLAPRAEARDRAVAIRGFTGGLSIWREEHPKSWKF